MEKATFFKNIPEKSKNYKQIKNKQKIELSKKYRKTSDSTSK